MNHCRPPFDEFSDMRAFRIHPVVSNSAWVVADKVVRTGGTLLLGIWTARVLGPSDFGILAFAQSVLAPFAAIAALGTQTILVRDLVRYPSSAAELLGSAILLRVAASGAAIITCLATFVALRGKFPSITR